MIAASSASAIPGYTVTARVLHWLIAALVLPMIVLGIIIANEWGGPVQQPLYDLHKSIGALLLPLVLLRLVYRLMNRHDFIVDLERAEKNAAHEKREADERAKLPEPDPTLGAGLRVAESVPAAPS